jgi:hypothetical protein
LALEADAAATAAQEAAAEAQRLKVELYALERANDRRRAGSSSAMPTVAEEQGTDGEGAGGDEGRGGAAFEEEDVEDGEGNRSGAGGGGGGGGGVGLGFASGKTVNHGINVESLLSARSDATDDTEDSENGEDGEGRDEEDDEEGEGGNGGDDDDEHDEKEAAKGGGGVEGVEEVEMEKYQDGGFEGRFTPRGTFLPPISPRTAAARRNEVREAQKRQGEGKGSSKKQPVLSADEKLALMEKKREKAQLKHVKKAFKEASELSLKLAERALRSRVGLLLAETAEGERQELSHRLAAAQSTGPPPSFEDAARKARAAMPGGKNGHTPATAAAAAAAARPLGPESSKIEVATHHASVAAAAASVGLSVAAQGVSRFAHSFSHDVFKPLAEVAGTTLPAVAAKEGMLALKRSEWSEDGKDRTVVRLTILGGATRREAEQEALLAVAKKEQARAHGLLMGTWASARAAVLVSDERWGLNGRRRRQTNFLFGLFC